MQIIETSMSFDDNATIHFYSQQTIDGVSREVVIYQDPKDTSFMVGRCDDGDFMQDEEHATLHQAFASVLRSHIYIPL